MSQQYSYGGGGYGAGGAGGGQGYGQPPHQGGGGGGGGYGAPPPGQGGYGAPPPHQGGGYGAPGGGGYGAGAGAGAAGGGYAPSSYGPPGGRPQAYTPNTGPPPGADPQLWAWFTAVDRDHSGNINPVELQQALVNGDWTPFELDTVKLLMTIFDVDRSGSITFNEERYCPQFAGLWKYIQDWQGVFRHFDADRSGSIDQTELSRALANFGYNLNPRLLHIVVAKFSTPRGGVTFDRFVRCCVVIKTLTDNFARKDVQRTGHVTLSYDEWVFMELCLSAP